MPPLPRSARHVAIAACLAMTLMCSGCRGHSSKTGLFPVVLQTDGYPEPQMGGFYQAQLKELYKAQGLDVKIVPGGPSIVGEEQVATGAAQFAMGSSDVILVDVSRGLPLVAVAATMQQDQQAIMVHANSSVHTFADLAGHTVAVKPGSIWFQYILKKYNLKDVHEVPATYNVANFLADPNYIQQCIVTSGPNLARKAGADVRTLLVSTTGYQPYRVIFTSRSFLSKHPDIVAEFVKASLEGWQDYLQAPATVDHELAKLNPAMSPEQIQFSADTLKRDRFVEGDGTADSHLGHFTAKRWDENYQQLLDLKVIAHPFDPGTAYTLRFAP